MLVNCQVSHIYFSQGYPDPLSAGMIAEAGIGFECMAFSFGSSSQATLCKEDAWKNIPFLFYKKLQ